MKIGLIKEGKVPPDHRVPLAPFQCVEVMAKFPETEIFVQSSSVRKYKDEEYEAFGIPVVDDVSHCDILMGVKEVNKQDLIPNKKYLFFSHTLKKQPYNRELLNEILRKKIQLIDYEVLTNQNNTRLIGFGRYAGIVGCYNGILTYGKKHQLFNLKPAHQCDDRVDLENELKKVNFPNDTKIVLTGFGRVGNGAREILQTLDMKEVNPEDFLNLTFSEPVFTQLEVHDYYERTDGKPFDKKAFYQSGEGHQSTFKRFLEVANMYIPCHYWSSTAPFIITKNDLKDPKNKISVVADISCDIDGPIACTIKPSKIADPVYGYNPFTEKEDDYMKEDVIAVMAVDNLPCELPKDASEDFGNELIKNIFPHLLGDDNEGVIERASQTNLNGELTPKFKYLEKYCRGEE